MFKKLIPFLLMVAMLFVVSCDNPTNGGGGGGDDSDDFSSDDFVGSWSWDGAGEDIELTSDGNILYDGEEIGTWSIDASTGAITLEVEGEDSTEYTLDETGGDGNSNIPVWTDEDGVELSTTDAPVLEQIVEDEESSDDGDDEGDNADDTEEITNISLTDDSRMGMSVSWDAVDGARSYMVNINGETDSELPITGIPYRPDADIQDGDEVKVEAFSDPNTEDLIAVGTITYGESADEGETAGNTPEEYVGQWGMIVGGTGVTYELKADGSVIEYRDGDQFKDSDTWSVDEEAGTLTIGSWEYTLDEESGDPPTKFSLNNESEVYEKDAGSTTPGVKYTVANFAGTWRLESNPDVYYTLSDDGNYTYSGGADSGSWSINATADELTLGVYTFAIDDSGDTVKLVRANGETLISTDAAVNS